jgi:hypothetical protein
MKKALIVSLVCVNVLLVAALIHANVGNARAQALRGGNDFIMVTGRVEAGLEAVYIIDMKTQTLNTWFFDRTTKKLRKYAPRSLTTDLKRTN